MPLARLLVAGTLFGFCQQDSSPCPKCHMAFFLGRGSVSLFPLIRWTPVIGLGPALTQHDPILI